MNEQLKPCPFCGGAAELDTQRAYRTMADSRLGTEVVIYCLKCGAEISICLEDVHGCTFNEVIAQLSSQWNTRADAILSHRPADDELDPLEELE